MFRYLSNNKKSFASDYRKQDGFTLIELMVVISIMAIMSGVAIFNYSDFRGHISLQNLSDDIALSVRKAQSYAVGVRGYNNNFSGYGVHFNLDSKNNNPHSGSNKSFIIFANLNDDKRYHSNEEECGNPSKQNECLEELNITSADKISEIIIGLNGRAEIRNTESGTIDIFFNRPNPEPTFCYRDKYNNGVCDQDTSITYVKITVSNINNAEKSKTVTIWNNGQISID
jgi:prepilin-type N-terminal cleavage/methylation domain-containing protein